MKIYVQFSQLIFFPFSSAKILPMVTLGEISVVTYVQVVN